MNEFERVLEAMQRADQDRAKQLRVKCLPLSDDRMRALLVAAVQELGVIRSERELALNQRYLLPDLSRREHEVLHLMSMGMRNAEISEHLGITVRTVKFHSEKIFRALGVHSRTEAVVRARQAAEIAA